MNTQSTENISSLLISMGYLVVPITQNIAGQLIINGVEGLYILDSGAGQTVVDTKQCENLNLKLNMDDATYSGGGLGVHSIETIPSYNNKIEINGFKIDTLPIAVMSLASAWESLAVIGAQEDLYGIMGVDLLRAGEAILDFNTMTLYLRKVIPQFN
ncbi:MAG: aspartyl protease family protein [Saprospiraceae bacterium]|nr:aspartyl protease family protein [Saprospiraceae bacterium]MBK7738779.1 aspartyl protease family protein [Saprospiraceae bacterium]MBK7912649.1 aspartyl protease family protein [Saprospiraceae bacterium]